MSSTLADQILAGNRRAIARLITHIERNDPRVQPVLNQLYSRTGRAHLVGVTGAPGTGKSSLVNELTKVYRAQGRQVAILAVDPTSPFSGGAILGDRIRMRELAGDQGVFIRSMASRGNMGGLSRAVDDAVKVLDAAGFELVIIETVGAGQGEVDIATSAQTILVVEAPGLGDDIQAIKAGILEIADILVVNKADRPEADRTASSLIAMLELGQRSAQPHQHHGRLLTESQADTPSLAQPAASDWQIPVLKTIALKGEGIAALAGAIDHHLAFLENSGNLLRRNRARLAAEVEKILRIELMTQLMERIPVQMLSATMADVVDRRLTPYAAARAILEKTESPDDHPQANSSKN